MSENRNGGDSKFERRMLAALRRIVHAIDLHSRELLEQFEVTAPQLVCLHVLAGDGELSSRALAAKVHVNPSTIVGILDRLQKKGFVQRRRDERDRRTVFVGLTAKGTAFVRQAPSPLQASLLDRTRGLSVAKQRSLAESLEEIVKLMQADELEDMPVLASSRYAKRRSR
ncbi:MAG: MarR family transcriptional regulator [Planctomycetia bacterium]|nr:MarR family transcriptional regulator [Planctomycetia bacterium]